MNKPHKGKKRKRIILCAGFFTLMFFLFAGKTIMAAGYSDEELIKIYTDYSDLFKQNDLVSNAFRSLGCGVLSFLVVIADGASGLFEKSFGMIDFTKYQPVQDFISDWQVVWVALLCAAIGWLGINLVFNSDKNPKIATNICVAILVVTSMTWMVSQMNTLLTKGIRNEILGTTTTNTVYATLGNNVHDLRYIDSVVGLGNLGSKNADGVTYAKAGTPMNKKIWKALKINEIVKQYDSNAKVVGEGPLMKDLVEISDHDFNSVNTVSIGIIFVIMMFVLKSISLPVLLVIAIEFAIFINMGIPYYTNTTIPFIASIVIGTIQLGATIDYAILITTKYIQNRKDGKDKKQAVSEALGTSINSMIVSGLCFFGATFGVGAYSKIEMIGSLCTLMSRGAIISVIVVITVLPAFLMIFDKLVCKTTIGMREVKN